MNRNANNPNKDDTFNPTATKRLTGQKTPKKETPNL